VLSLGGGRVALNAALGKSVPGRAVGFNKLIPDKLIPYMA
jgi:hypothetical protein